jgi:hypothetical protein
LALRALAMPFSWRLASPIVDRHALVRDDGLAVGADGDGGGADLGVDLGGRLVGQRDADQLSGAGGNGDGRHGGDSGQNSELLHGEAPGISKTNTGH